MSLKRVVETFEAVAAVSSRTAKIALLSELKLQDAVTFQEVVKYAVYPFWTYRLSAPDCQSVAPKFETLNDEQSNILWESFKQVLDLLRNRQCELAEGRSALKDVICTAPPLFRKYLVQIVNRDLKIGVQDFNKFFPKLIPAEPVMLCEKWDGEELTGSWIAEPKWDGYRAAVMIDGEGNCNAVSRGNKEFWNWDHIAQQLQALGLRNVVLDGEFYAGTWGQTSSICKSQKLHKDAHLLNYYIFDMLTMDEWNAQQCQRVLSERKQLLSYTLLRDPLATGKASPNVVVADFKYVRGIEECAEAGDCFYQMGYEGSVLKRMSSVYVWDRTTDWLKIKPEEECDVEVIDTYVGKGKYAGCLGGVIVKGTVTYKKKQYEVVSRCGGGFKDKEREEFWAKREQIIGTTIQVLYQDVSSAITLQVVPGKQALRFPRFQRLRLDKTPNGVGLNVQG